MLSLSERHDGTDCSATMVPITVLRMVPIQRYRHFIIFYPVEFCHIANYFLLSLYSSYLVNALFYAYL